VAESGTLTLPGMELLTKQTLQTLAAAAEPPCVSIFLPLQRSGAHALENVKRLKSVLSDVEQRLATIGLSPKGRIQFLAHARAFAEEELAGLNDAEGIALFLSANSGHWFALPNPPKELLFIGTNFLVTPLLPFIRSDEKFWILAISANRCRLIQAGRESVVETVVPGMPISQEDAWRGMEHMGESLQGHSTGPNGTYMFHGQGGFKDQRDIEQAAYVQKVGKALAQALVGQKAPLIMAGVEEFYGLVRKYLPYDHFSLHYVRGNADDLSAEQLRQKALPIAEPLLDRLKDEALGRFNALVGNNRTSTHIRTIIEAAREGRVETLLLADGFTQWGSIDPQTGELNVHAVREEHDEELCGMAATQTLMKDGDVVVIAPEKMPMGAGVAAVLRY
jgi:hypothetical protein